jgi:murein DD-endopeptidase MepM/ murein hydrolase activator NlpD
MDKRLRNGLIVTQLTVLICLLFMMQLNGCAMQAHQQLQPRAHHHHHPDQAHFKTPVHTAKNVKIRPIAWRWPARGKVVLLRSHAAIHIIGKANQSVYPAASGSVIYRKKNAKHFGGLLIIKHDSNTMSTYAHLNHIAVKLGQKVIIGQKIGDMGMAKSHTGFLYFSILKQSVSVNPLLILQKRN